MTVVAATSVAAVVAISDVTVAACDLAVLLGGFRPSSARLASEVVLGTLSLLLVVARVKDITAIVAVAPMRPPPTLARALR